MRIISFIPYKVELFFSNRSKNLKVLNLLAATAARENMVLLKYIY